ncbi:hypothetical protein NTG1052_140125 [Candidatus Nitrotoga sp. 1052]|nr:hypothetical protein NTG1052_140125 [Candidatus Nitrotoga sp. 1052]
MFDDLTKEIKAQYMSVLEVRYLVHSRSLGWHGTIGQLWHFSPICHFKKN